MKIREIPQDGLAGLKQNWASDALSGFMVFLLALPLSLGIAKASGFPAANGVLTAMIGGLVVSIFMGGRMTIKGPAAGLITVCSGAILDLGKLNIQGVTAVELACGVIATMAVLQFILGLLKLGSLSDFFPHSVVHGMLAAIGVLIFAKQFPILLGVDAALTKGLSPIELYTHIPVFLTHANAQIAIIGLLSMAILFGLPALGGFFKKIPAPMIVLLVAIPLGINFRLHEAHPAFLVSIGDFWKNVSFSASWAAVDTWVFWKYVIMFLFVNSLESLLTVKALDGLDPWKRKSDYNKDLRALAIGNGVSGLLGGLPMISEVARSSANVGFGGRTRWSNFFHGAFLLIAMLFLIPFIEMIPSAALAAMLIAVAYRLASPKEFIGTYKIGREQLVIFLVTIAVTVATDLLMGVAAGIVVKLLFHLIHGAPLSSLFKAAYTVHESEREYKVEVRGAATFSNFLGYKKLWASFKPGKNITMDFSAAKLVDHSFMEQLHHLEEDKQEHGISVTLAGLEKFSPLSAHPLAARKASLHPEHIKSDKLDSRQLELWNFARTNGYAFTPKKIRNAAKYKDFPIQKGNRILYEENMLIRDFDMGKVEIADMTITEGARHANSDTHITVLHVDSARVSVPNFALEPEGLGTRLSELIVGKDIDFEGHVTFSRRYYLRSDNESMVREFFNERVIRFLESQEDMHIESHDNSLLLYKRRDLLNPDEITKAVAFAESFIHLVAQQVVLKT